MRIKSEFNITDNVHYSEQENKMFNREGKHVSSSSLRSTESRQRKNVNKEKYTKNFKDIDWGSNKSRSKPTAKKLTGSSSIKSEGAGKGDSPRPVDKVLYDENYAAIFSQDGDNE